jgi:aspartate/methionine/tyrosine aminotransferase
VYRGAELADTDTASMWGRYERVIVTSGLSKAYGLPGLRIGWIAGPPAFVESTWSYHDYTTIAPGALSDRLARVALSAARRPALLQRTRAIVRANWPLIDAWLRAHEPAFSWIPPEAGAIVYVRYNYPINSTELVTRLRDEKSVLIVPGDHFGMDGYLRLGFGERPDYLTQGLERLHSLLASLSGAHARA